MAMSAEIPERPFKTRDTCTRETPRRAAKASTVMSSGKLPENFAGMGRIMHACHDVLLVIVLIVDKDRILAFE